MNLCPSTQISQVDGVHSPLKPSGVPKHPKDPESSVSDWHGILLQTGASCILSLSRCKPLHKDWGLAVCGSSGPPCPLVMKSQGHVRLVWCCQVIQKGQIIRFTQILACSSRKLLGAWDCLPWLSQYAWNLSI